ncbi:hypothetical protein NLX86_09030 [Streptomyces sp. A3M-1-3]|uniref:hypothetical protein n=1 Tax=Streptomyces sp. A3M-1-3 TaxID=2962044 RepID=UPI0020B8B21E|nr:hypothetical protein [Streptomyces sp. A3M-1-3]MCP3818253.1 hypothetical protein [Streptomyces sp. A3M-1-3]
MYDGLAEYDAHLSAAVLARPALAERLRDPGRPLVAWGQTAAFGRLAGGALAEGALAEGALRYESKQAANAMFRRLAATGGHPGIAVPDQTRAGTRRTAARLLAARARAGETTVLKSEYGVGGSGTAAPGISYESPTGWNWGPGCRTRCCTTSWRT